LVSEIDKDLHLAGIDTEPEMSINPQFADQAGELEQVLVVEDNQEVRNYIAKQLESKFLVEVAENGIQGLSKARELLPDLIISDVMMPEMDGYNMTASLKKDSLTSHIPVILLTAKASDEEKIEGLETGADAYMSKPFNVKELEVRVKKLIENRRLFQEKIRNEILVEPRELNNQSFEDEFISRVHNTIIENMADPEFNVEMLTQNFSLSQRQFTRKVTALTGQAPAQFIRVIRLNKARQLISQKAGSVSQIAFDVGFNNLSYFSKCYRQQFGCLPSEQQ